MAILRRSMRAVLVGTTIVTATAAGAVPLAEFGAQERARVLSLGPWPPAGTPDPSNRVSGNRDAIALGGRLFFDARLSPSGYIACVTCHQTDRAWTDLKPRAHGLADLTRNTPALNNLRLQRWFGWGGGADSLWMASLRPLLDPREFDSNPAWVAHIYEREPELACFYERAFGHSPNASGVDLETVLVNTAKALAAYEETLVTGRTAFDEFRDALARNDATAAARYPPLARRGLLLFIGRGNCIACHNGANFSNGEFADIGVPFFAAPGEVDPGRYQDLQKLRTSRFNLLGRHSDAAGSGPATAMRQAVLEPRHWGEFKVPSLRNVAVTAPYMHNGSLPTLHDVLRHYSNLDESRIHSSALPVLQALRLSAEEEKALLAFLVTLTDEFGADRPRPSALRCESPAAPGQVR
jgi:cytochrome c peroxidase